MAILLYLSSSTIEKAIIAAHDTPTAFSHIFSVTPPHHMTTNQTTYIPIKMSAICYTLVVLLNLQNLAIELSFNAGC